MSSHLRTQTIAGRVAVRLHPTSRNSMLLCCGAFAGAQVHHVLHSSTLLTAGRNGRAAPVVIAVSYEPRPIQSLVAIRPGVHKSQRWYEHWRQSSGSWALHCVLALERGQLRRIEREPHSLEVD